MRKLLECFAIVATEEEVRPYVDIVGRLMGDDAYYARASDAAREAGLAFIRAHRGRFAQIVEGLLELA